MAVTSTRAERQHSHSEHLRCSSPPATHHWRDSVFLALGANVHTRFASCIVGTWPCETPVVMYGCKSWDYKEGWMLKNWCFQIVVLEKTLESPFDGKESNQSILKEINPEYSLEGLMLKLKLKLQYFDHVMWRAELLEKTSMLGKTEGKRRRRRERQRMRWLDSISTQ